MINYLPFIDHIRNTRLEPWCEPLAAQLQQTWDQLNDGNLARLLAALETLPSISANSVELDRVVAINGPVGDAGAQLNSALKALMPWRKGPFRFFDIDIDAEWRCDLKWDRIANHLSDLRGRHVLDVGSGNGYYGWRMKAAGAATVAGIDPSWLSVVQHLAVNRYIKDPSHTVLPFTLESLPPNLGIFDTVFSMGVLYHRRSPLDHLAELRGALRPGGELVLETLVIQGQVGESLVPIGRYARMNNVWFLPTVPTLVQWLEKMGFENIRLVDQSTTSTDEQRPSDWKPGQSLADYLNPEDPSLTIEGHPAPIRALILATRPELARLKRYHLD
ncbi:MAG: tRNA 5-methoxyuridine(34)/uridine 5-oxyacetic acid(34) synthase CmoB [Reinekea forsetii]|uniref:tRNA 5-methoxyuridine(34)/uridine 5-oxyacetic acid(34) synthase CmoB n=1 Tax=Reinekea sp. TaxID=1970455 RepID=UPI0025811AE8|nr:tRNA 5-methoxyuridine(34)/uridine 5-oxyacetic acid(34) synthase CmoB [Reinekea sp.]MDO7673080.1 tRNA 5-methoxyuridine(34)/uridine 5-oxyacetic acid(34) synthase CmoB [Reinekea forsetii]